MLIDRHLARLRAFSRRAAATPPRPTTWRRTFSWPCAATSTPTTASFPSRAGCTASPAKSWRISGAATIGSPPSSPSQEAVEPRSPADIHQEADDAADAWKEVFARLPEAQASALWLRVQEDLSVEEIARTMEVSLSNAKVLLFRARQTLTPFFKTASTCHDARSFHPRSGGLRHLPGTAFGNRRFRRGPAARAPRPSGPCGACARFAEQWLPGPPAELARPVPILAAARLRERILDAASPTPG